jgi:hypothetical protein
LVTEDTVQTVGLRFPSVAVPRGAIITRAWIQFTADEKASAATALTIRAQASDAAAAFSRTTANVSSRPRTGASTDWAPAAWSTVGEAGAPQQTTDLSAVVREVTDRSGWVGGNALVFIITGSGRRAAVAFDGVPSGAPLLHVEYRL